MSMRLARLGPRRPVAALVAVVVALVAVGVVLRRSDPAPEPLNAVVALSPSGVQRLLVEADGRQADLTRHARGWSGSSGTPPQSGALLLSTEDELFPMLAYRVVRADPADPQFGLAAPVAAVRLEDRAGTPVSLRVGAASFSGAGFYAGRDDAPGRVYLVPRNTVDLLRSLATGERKSSADSLEARARRHQADQDAASREKEISTYLRQAVEAGGQTPAAPPEPAP
jgi:hypothetical protein